MLASPTCRQTVFPTFVISGLSNVGDGGNVGTQLRRATYYQLADSISFTRGRHYFKVGVDLRKSMMSNFQPSMPSGQFSFATNQTGLLKQFQDRRGGGKLPSGPGSAAALNLGSYNYLLASVYDTFIQDDFRVSSRLTLNLGLRWEPNINYSEKYNRLTWFDPSVGHVVFAGQGGQRTTNYPNHYPNFSPRVGVAYSIPSLKECRTRGLWEELHNTAVASNPGTPLEMAFPYSGSSQVPAGGYPTDPVFSLHQFAGFAPGITPAQCQATPANVREHGGLDVSMIPKPRCQLCRRGTLPWNASFRPARRSVWRTWEARAPTYIPADGRWCSCRRSCWGLRRALAAFRRNNGRRSRRSPAFQIGMFEGSSTYSTPSRRQFSTGSRQGSNRLAFTWDKCLEDVGSVRTEFNYARREILLSIRSRYQAGRELCVPVAVWPGRKFIEGNGIAPKMLGGGTSPT